MKVLCCCNSVNLAYVLLSFTVLLAVARSLRQLGFLPCSRFLNGVSLLRSLGFHLLRNLFPKNSIEYPTHFSPTTNQCVRIFWTTHFVWHSLLPSPITTTNSKHFLVCAYFPTSDAAMTLMSKFTRSSCLSHVLSSCLCLLSLNVLSSCTNSSSLLPIFYISFSSSSIALLSLLDTGQF